MASLSRRTVDIGSQRRSVAHGGGHIEVDVDALAGWVWHSLLLCKRRFQLVIALVRFLINGKAVLFPDQRRQPLAAGAAAESSRAPAPEAQPPESDCAT